MSDELVVLRKELIADLVDGLGNQLDLLAHVASAAHEHDKKVVDDVFSTLRCVEKLFDLSTKLSANSSDAGDTKDGALVSLINEIEDRIEVLSNERAADIRSGRVSGKPDQEGSRKRPFATADGAKAALSE